MMNAVKFPASVLQPTVGDRLEQGGFATRSASRVKQTEVDELRAENRRLRNQQAVGEETNRWQAAEIDRLRRQLRAARRFLEDSQRPEWTDAERAVATQACFRQLDLATGDDSRRS